ncbi:MAG: DUF86 domain-containing protein [Firmicutes bacterium]|nr:DUF86 domain-containing protein [Bacillota bacterium]MCM1402112.1 DUF86 domain-containing protein [Bacteroides sp.]
MDETVLKYLEDVRLACEDVEYFFVDYPNRFDVFSNDRLMIRAVERSVEIMGEAINRILRREPDFNLPNARVIVQTRNRVIHSYEKVENEFLWGLVKRHIPKLKADVERIIAENESFYNSENCAMDRDN